MSPRGEQTVTKARLVYPPTSFEGNAQGHLRTKTQTTKTPSYYTYVCQSTFKTSHKLIHSQLVHMLCLCAWALPWFALLV